MSYVGRRLVQNKQIGLTKAQRARDWSLVTQLVSGAARAEAHDSQSRGHFPPPPPADSFNLAFCKGNRVTLEPARIQPAQDVGCLCGLAGGLAAIACSRYSFFLPFLFFSKL